MHIHLKLKIGNEEFFIEAESVRVKKDKQEVIIFRDNGKNHKIKKGKLQESEEDYLFHSLKNVKKLVIIGKKTIIDKGEIK
ncbi:MAG: hypothetical protein ACOCP8_04735 [archaeon]